MKDGFVLSILEHSFPHKIVFMILEPVSHIQWSHIISDEKLNQIESRADRVLFVRECRKQLESGMVQGVSVETVQII